MKHERFLITVKTYPTLSRSHGELVCTAGVREDGSWIRLYPIPFRLLEYEKQYKKFDWIETRLVKSRKDDRPESFHPADRDDIKKIDHLGTEDNWRERRRLILGHATVCDRLQPLVEAAKANQLSLATFKPARVLDFIWEADDREWDELKVQQMRSRADQGELFAAESWRRDLKLMPKLPWKFSYRLEDADGKGSTMQVLDWETGQLYWNCLKSTDGDEQAALAKVRQKYLVEFAKKDLHLFLGTTLRFHSWAKNPWVIIGVFPIPHERRIPLL